MTHRLVTHPYKSDIDWRLLIPESCLQDATGEHRRALAAAETASGELQRRLERQLVSTSHTSAVAQRSAEEEAAQLRARLASSQGALNPDCIHRS